MHVLRPRFHGGMYAYFPAFISLQGVETTASATQQSELSGNAFVVGRAELQEGSSDGVAAPGSRWRALVGSCRAGRWPFSRAQIGVHVQVHK